MDDNENDKNNKEDKKDKSLVYNPLEGIGNLDDFKIEDNTSTSHLVFPLDHLEIREPLEHLEPWKSLKKLFYSRPSIAHNGIGSILNSAIVQKRLVFAYCRSQIGQMLVNDPNLPNRTSKQINGTEKKKIICEGINSKHIEIVVHPVSRAKGSKGSPGIFKVIQPEIQKAVSVLLKKPVSQILGEQEKELFDFIGQNKFSIKVVELEEVIESLENFKGWLGDENLSSSGEVLNKYTKKLKAYLREELEYFGLESPILDEFRMWFDNNLSAYNSKWAIYHLNLEREYLILNQKKGGKNE